MKKSYLKVVPQKYTVDQATTKIRYRCNGKKIGILLGSMLVVLLLASTLVLGSGWFTLKQVIVKGNQNFSTEMIVLAAHLDSKQNLCLLNYSKITAGITANPNIASVKLTPVFPGCLIITVKERHSRYFLLQGDKKYFVSDDWVILNVAGKVPVNLPEIKGIGKLEIRPGKRLSNAQISRVQKITESIKSPWRQMIGQIDIAHFILQLNIPGNPRQVRVLLGDESEIRDKIERLQVVLAAITKRASNDVLAIDLRTPGISTITSTQSIID